MEVDHMLRFWTFLPCKFIKVYFKKSYLKKSTFFKSALSCPDGFKRSSKNDQSMNSLSSSSPRKKSLKNSASGVKWLKSYYTAIKSKENDSFSDLKSIFLLSCKNLATETNRFSSVGVALQSLALNLERWCIQTLMARFRPFFESTWWYHL